MIELQQYAKKNKPNLHILSKLQEEMKRLAEERVSTVHNCCPLTSLLQAITELVPFLWQLWRNIRYYEPIPDL